MMRGRLRSRQPRRSRSFTEEDSAMWNTSERGQSTVMYVVSVMASLGTLGLVVDVGYGYYRRHVAQAAAESAALAMASAAAAASPCAITCGTGGVACDSTPV